MSDQADVIVVGMGTGGEEIAGGLALAGLDVVGIEPLLVGGECAYWACIPTKMMIRAAKLLQEARRVNGFAGRCEVTPDWAPVSARVREQATGDWDDSLAVQRFKNRGGRFIRGRGRLIGPRTVAVGEQRFEARKGIVIATGSKPTIPPIPGLADAEYWTTHDVIRARSLPVSLVILGGGAVGCEIGQVFARFGVQVTIVEGGARLLSGEEPEVSAVLASVFESERIAVRFGSRARRVRKEGRGIVVELEDGSEVSAERLLVAVGRSVDASELGLESAGIQLIRGGIPVDDRLRAADGIWAMGDVTRKAMFTHVALYHAGIVEADILGRNPPPAEYRALSRATFTDPEIGAVGMREADARAAGLNVAVAVKRVPLTFRGWIHGPGNDGVIKLVADRNTGVLVGATYMGPSGGDVLGMLTTAVHARIPLTELARMIYAFPSFHGGVGEALGAYARALVQVLDPDAAFLLDEILQTDH